MKTLILAALAATTIGGAAHAQSYDGWQNHSNSYDISRQVVAGDQLYVRVLADLDRGVRSGSIDRHQAADVRRRADQIRAHAWNERRRGVYDPGEAVGRYNQLLNQIAAYNGRDQRYGYNSDRDGQYGNRDGRWDNRDGQYDNRNGQYDNRDAYRDPNYPR